MSDDRSGIDRLRRVVEEVAQDLGPPAVRPRRARRVARAVPLAALGLIVVAGWWIARSPARRETTTSSPARLGIEVKLLRLRGRDVDPRVFDAAGARTIVVAPRQPTDVGPAVFLLPRGD